MSSERARAWPALAAVLVIAALWTVAISWTWLPAGARTAVSDIGQVVAAFGAGAACVRRARPPTPEGVRRFWFYLGAGCASWGTGQLVWTVYELGLHRDAPFPSVADLGFLAMPPLIAVALLASPLAATTTAGRLRSVLDGMLVALSALLINWVLVLRTVFDAGGDGPLATAVSLAYPIGDVVVITVVLYAGLGKRQLLSSDRSAYFVVAAGLLAIAVADSGFAYRTATHDYATGALMDAGWFLGFLVVAVAPLFRGAGRRRRRLPGIMSLPATFLPFAVVAVAMVGSTIDLAGRGSIDLPAVWLRTAITVLLVARLLFTLLENRSLTRGLEARVAARTAELRASRQRFAALVAHSSDVTMVLDRRGSITYLSEASERVLGWAPAALLGAQVTSAIGAEAEIAAFRAALEHTVEEPLRVHTIASTWSGDGERRSLELTLTNLLDNPDVSGIVLNIHNVTDRKLLEEQLVHQAFHDALTGMANRAHFRERLESAVAERESAPGVSVLFADLDGFKLVNDTLGHGAGDRVLREVADRIVEVVGDSGVVARVGGDEFAVLVDGRPDRRSLADLAGRITSTLRVPFHLDGREIHLAGSIGIADLTPEVATAEQLLRNADLAMYEAKASGDGGFAFFEPAMHDALVERVRLEEDLRSSVDSNDFEVHYQPLFAIDTGRVTGVEALVRWRHPTRGLVNPAEFIPAAESTGLIRPLGLWVLDTACRQGAEWQSAVPAGEGLKVSVNVSARQLDQPDLMTRIAQILEQTGLPPSCLVLEMTEGVLMVDSSATLATLTAMRALGIRIAMDDFGTGYSSLSYLHHFTVDMLKIDRSFIKGLAAGQDAALVRSIVQLAQSLGLETVAEGIEREYELRLLRGLGCTTGQGYYLSPPVPARALSGILARQRERMVAAASET